ncbi:MAG: DUF4375 domain-containing protein [Planctomycetia bacterium]|nr:DUF4375 domain-containing protein [Planctomycetia bacterium]
MPRTLDEILAEPDDGQLCVELFDRIVAHHGPGCDVSELTEAERVVLLVWEVAGIVGNGGFRYLFEKHLHGDPDFALTAQAFQIIGARSASQAVRATLALFPHSKPPRDIQKRLRHYLSQLKDWPTAQDMQFFDSEKERESCLAAYIRAHAADYRHLDGPPRAQPEPESSEPTDHTAPTIGNLLDRVPHWKRVAFAARAARCVLPLLTRCWPDIPGKYPRYVLNAIELAEQSAIQEEPASGLKDAVMHAVITAGAALATHRELASAGPKPRNAFEGGIAASAAKAAEKAAEAAEGPAEKSAYVALDGWTFAHSAATDAEDEALLHKLESLLNEVRPAERGRAEADGDQLVSDAVHRGLRWFILAAVPLALVQIATVLLALTGKQPAGWWSSFVLPAFILYGLYSMWRGVDWVSRLLPPFLILTSAVSLLRIGHAVFKLAQLPLTPLARELLVNLFGVSVPVLIAVELFTLIGGVVLLLPSVREFVDSQRGNRASSVLR